MRSWLSLFFALAAPAALFAAPEPTSKPESQPTPKIEKAEASKSAKPSTSEDERLNAVLEGIPAGQVYQGVHIPSYNKNGKLQSLFDAKVAKRIGDREIEMQDLKIEIHNDDGTTFHVEMAHSVFNFDSNILKSDTPTTIKRDGFVINGDKAEFNVKGRFGRMTGNVKMVIFNSGETK